MVYSSNGKTQPAYDAEYAWHGVPHDDVGVDDYDQV
jgi:hypothetical protein